MESHTETGRIKLNLVMTYPVRWSRTHVMQDYIQNFYDITGAEKFSWDFNYCYNEKSQTLRMKSNKGFSAEWLQYMGVSTKREDNGSYTAGKFGEGFNREAPDEGFARTSNADRTIKNSLGLRTVAHIKEICLRKELFFRNAFPKAMVVYMHELLHQFGGDASRQFRAAILAMDHRILEEAEKLEDYEREWMETDHML